MGVAPTHLFPDIDPKEFDDIDWSLLSERDVLPAPPVFRKASHVNKKYVSHPLLQAVDTSLYTEADLMSILADADQSVADDLPLVPPPPSRGERAPRHPHDLAPALKPPIRSRRKKDLTWEEAGRDDRQRVISKWLVLAHLLPNG